MLRRDHLGTRLTTFAAQRLAVLVDTAYVYRAARRSARGRLDYRKLLDGVVAGRAVVRAIAFVERQGDADIDPFVDALRALGFEVRVRPGHKAAPDSLAGAWDVGLALTAAALAPRIDAIALVAGSGALVDLLDHLEVSGVRTELYAFPEAVDGDLALQADAFHALGDALAFDTP